MTRMVTYECRKCGTKVIVTEAHATNLQPIYCCGMQVSQVDSVRRQLAAKAPKGSGKEKGKYGKTAGKAVKKETAGRVKASPKKKASKNMKKK
jgi:hypothetical protein